MSDREDLNLYEFGEFRLDRRESVLRRGGELIVLPPKVFETLYLLVKKQGGIVSKTEMLDTIWADSFVEESNLTQNIYTLRKILGRDENGRQLIETVARRGYRIAVPVRVMADDAAAFAGENRPHQNLLAEIGTIFAADTALSFDDLGSSVPERATVNPPLETPPETASMSPGKKNGFRRWPIFLGTGFFILLALGFGIYRFVGTRAEKNNAPVAPIEQLRFQRLTDSGDVVYPTISPDGEWLAFVRLEDANGSLWVKQIATDSAVRILPPSAKGYRSLTFSPDGKYLYFRQDTDGGPIFQTSILGATAKKVAENVWSDFGIAPDGKQLSFIRRDPPRNRYLLILSNLDGSGERELSSRAAPADYRNTPAFSPDGTMLVVASGGERQFFPKLLTVSLSDGAETELKTPRWRAVQRALWLPDGKSLIVSARDEKEPYSQLWLMNYPGGEIRRLTNDLEAYFWISLSADGRMIVTRQQKIYSHLWLLPGGDLKNAKQITAGGRNLDGYAGLAWSPDGKIVYTVFANNVTDLFAINPDGSNRVQLTANAGQDNTSPVVSPDGRSIVFISNRTGTTQIWRMDIDGRNQKPLTFNNTPGERVQSPIFSTDGTEIFYIRRGAGSSAIWKVPLDGGESVPVSDLVNASPEGFIALSPDGRRLAYHYAADKSEAGRETQKYRIGIVPLGEPGGAALPQVFDLPMRRPAVQWTGAATFDFSAGTYNSSELLRQPATGGEPQKLLEFPDRIFNFAWSPGNRDLVVARGKQHGDALLITNLFGRE